MIQTCDVQLGFERVDLSTVTVPSHTDAHHSQADLIRAAIDDLVCEKNHPCACAENRKTTAKSGAQFLEEVELEEKFAHRRALASRKDDAIETLEVPRRADPASTGTECRQYDFMGSERSL